MDRKDLSQVEYFDEEFYLDFYEDVREAVNQGVFRDGKDHYNQYGKQERRVSMPRQVKDVDTQLLDACRDAFDADFYAGAYPEVVAWCQDRDATLWIHYLEEGMRNGYSLNADFDEQWYRTYYPDVNEDVARGGLVSGFEHYVKVGKQEGRYPKLTYVQSLELLYPGITSPAGVARLKEVENKLTPPAVEFDPGTAKRLTFLLPVLDPDVFFGGYTALMNFAERVFTEGYELRFLVCEDYRCCEAWCLQKLREKKNIAFVENCDIVNITDRKKVVRVRRNERFLAYSSWLIYIAAELAKYTDEEKPLYLAQEDERVFHSNESLRIFIDDAYRKPHIPLINSRPLLKYFKKNSIGIFRDKSLKEGIDYFCFDHVLTKVERVTCEELEERSTKKFLLYARPENHALRNTFELAIVALKKAIKNCVFDPGWEFWGIGSLVDGLRVDLGAGFSMTIISKLPEAQYSAALKGFDVGLSLMAAPHPGLLHFEMANAGLVVTTNVYENRDAAFFEQKSPLIIPVELGVDDIAAGIESAVKMSSDIDLRCTAKSIDSPDSWSAVFDKSYIDKIVLRLWGES